MQDSRSSTPPVAVPEREIVYRELRRTAHGTELRWVVERRLLSDGASGAPFARGIIRHPGVCVIVPVLDDGRVVLIRQHRLAIGGELWEIPAGTLAGEERDGQVVAIESPADCARRELLEEAGYAATSVEALGSCYAMPGMTDEVIHAFAARGLQPAPSNPDVGEVIEAVEAFSDEQIDRMLTDGTICDAKTIVGLFLFRLRQSNGNGAA